jgi:hypothetical protein
VQIPISQPKQAHAAADGFTLTMIASPQMINATFLHKSEQRQHIFHGGGIQEFEAAKLDEWEQPGVLRR